MLLMGDIDLIYDRKLITHSINGVEYNVTNIFKRVDLSELNSEYLALFTLSGETATEVALKLYGSSEYYWILYVLNDIVNPFTDWYMTEDMLLEYCKLKYDDLKAPKVFFNNTTDDELSEQVSDDMQYLLDNNSEIPHYVSFYTNHEYEIIQNEKRKVIKVINKSNLIEFVNAYIDAIEE